MEINQNFNKYLSKSEISGGAHPCSVNIDSRNGDDMRWRPVMPTAAIYCPLDGLSHAPMWRSNVHRGWQGRFRGRFLNISAPARVIAHGH